MSMPNIESSDIALLDLLRKHGPLSVAQLKPRCRSRRPPCGSAGAPARQGDIERNDASELSRGRPVHRYALTERAAGGQGPISPTWRWPCGRRFAKSKTPRFAAGCCSGSAADWRRCMPGRFTVRRWRSGWSRWPRCSASGRFRLRWTHATTCRCCARPPAPIPELAEQDRTVCSMERMMFSELLGENVRLSDCRLDGHNCCTFEPTWGRRLACRKHDAGICQIYRAIDN